MSKQEPVNASRSIWWLQVLLAVIVCTWLYVAQSLHLSTLTVISATGGTIVLGGTVMAIRIDKLQQVWRRENRRLKQACASRSAFTAQLVETLPALHVMFATVQRKYASGPTAVYYFAEWLTWALKSQSSNLQEWIKTSSNTQTQQVSLHGLVKHIRPEHQDVAEQHAQDRAQGALVECTLRRLVSPTVTKQQDRPSRSVSAAT